jgi:cell wall-associated NlpC family hydrolase
MRDGGRSGLLWQALLALVATLSGAPVPAQATSDAGSEIVVQALGLVDAPYRYGGRAPTGFDCSGFVGYVFSQSAGLALPRRAEEIRRLGDVLDKGDLAAGDLVFFNTLGRRYSHVGIYVGEGQFVHAPARRGRVRVDRLGDPYWTARYNGARRLGASYPPVVAAAEAAPAASGGAEVTVDARITP